MITGILSNGFEVSVDENKVKTYRFAKMLGKASSKDINERLYANASILEYLIGEEKEEELIKYVESITGEEAKEPEMVALTLEIINLMKEEDKEIKNSVSSQE
jgi:hypothetical protein